MERAVQDALVAPGLGLPFLNEDNKQLLRDLQQLQLEVAEKGGALDTAQKLVQHKQEQLAHMTQALQQLQDLRSSQAKTTTAEEEHEKALRREIESTQRHNDGHQKQLHDQHQVQAFLESCIVQVSKELDHIYSTLELDAQLVDDLLDEIAAKESDNLLLLQYAREDASKVKSLSVALETICTAITSTENSLEQARGDVSVARTEQEQLVQAFVQTAAERDQLLQQWEMSLVQLQQKDDDMRRLLEDLILVAQQQGDMRKGIEREEVILSHIREACEEEEVLIKTIEAETERTQAQYLDVLNTRDILRGEVAALQNGLAKTRKDAELLKGRIQVLGSTREEKNNLLQQLQKQIQKAEEKLALDTELLLSTDESIHAMETIIKEMENGQTQLEKRVERLRSLLLQRSQELFRWQEAERLSLADLRTLHMTKKKLQAALRTLDEKDIQQKQVLYEQDLQIQHLRRRLHALTHDSNNNEVDPRQQQHVADLRERLHLVTLAKDLLTKQISSLQRLVQHEQSDVDRRQEACERLKEKLSEVQLSNVNAEREGLQLRGEREDLSVDITLLRLRIRGRLAQVAGTTASTNKLTHERSEMQKLVKEQCEGVHRRLVEMEGRRRSLATEIHELTKRTHLTSVRLQQLKDRYEEIKATLQAPQDAEELSPAFIMLKNFLYQLHPNSKYYFQNNMFFEPSTISPINTTIKIISSNTYNKTNNRDSTTNSNNYSSNDNNTNNKNIISSSIHNIINNRIINNSIITSNNIINTNISKSIIRKSVSGKNIISESIITNCIMNKGVAGNNIINNSMITSSIISSSSISNSIISNSIIYNSIVSNSIICNSIIIKSVTSNNIIGNSSSSSRIICVIRDSLISDTIINNCIITSSSISNSSINESSISESILNRSVFIKSVNKKNMIGMSIISHSIISKTIISNSIIKMTTIYEGIINKSIIENVIRKSFINKSINKCIISESIIMGNSNKNISDMSTIDGSIIINCIIKKSNLIKSIIIRSIISMSAISSSIIIKNIIIKSIIGASIIVDSITDSSIISNNGFLKSIITNSIVSKNYIFKSIVAKNIINNKNLVVGSIIRKSILSMTSIIKSIISEVIIFKNTLINCMVTKGIIYQNLVIQCITSKIMIMKSLIVKGILSASMVGNSIMSISIISDSIVITSSIISKSIASNSIMVKDFIRESVINKNTIMKCKILKSIISKSVSIMNFIDKTIVSKSISIKCIIDTSYIVKSIIIRSIISKSTVIESIIISCIINNTTKAKSLETIKLLAGTSAGLSFGTGVGKNHLPAVCLHDPSVASLPSGTPRGHDA
ncbi:uncharacterized protein LOC143026554 isoform X2 [Oratosquilla oratoria]|uniref:uncharacterized protein LOC143026554 isoform X2 n=1 Tax=Oratosquilla oratoria TaxID=337810 RepID=UPI003F773FA5